MLKACCMKRNPFAFAFTALVSFVATAADPGAPTANSSYQAMAAPHRLFDGKTFSGWEGDTNRTWRIENGEIAGGSLEANVPRNEFLCTTRSFTNFVLRLKFKLTGKSGFINSGVQFRSQRVKDPPNEMAGYQADIGDPDYWGSIYDEGVRNKTLIKADMEALNKVLKRSDWNEYIIRAEGRRVRLWINGLQTVDYTEPEAQRPQWGVIGLQIHGGAIAEARFKDLTLEELSAPAGSAALPRSSPEAQGVSSAGIRAFVEAADRQVIAMHSFMLVRHGRVVAEGWWKPEAADKPHVLHSLSKSFTSTAVGLAVAEGKLSVDDPVLRFFPEYAPAEPSDKLKAMRVRDLLTMTCGHEAEVKWTNAPWVQTFLAHPVPHKPGTHFQYNTPGSYMLSAIVQKVTGQTVLDYLRPRLFEPLGIENPEWGASPQGVTFGGWGLKLRTEDIAKFGQLYLQRGKWNGKQLVPASWVEQATSKQVSNGSDPGKDWDQGYGFQFWRCRHGAFRGDGANGQFCLVLPEQDAVIAITADTRDMQAELNVVWDNLLPAFHPKRLRANKPEQLKLQETLASLAVH